MPTATAPSSQAQMIGSVGDAALDWDGNPLNDEEGYEDYLNSRPSKADLKRYAKPVCFWEVLHPGTALQPYPTMGTIDSLVSGLWMAQNPSQERHIREYLLQSTHLDPDLLKLTDHELDVMNGRAVGEIRFCQDCTFIACSLVAVNLHETLNGHSTKSTPRKDR